MMKRTTNLEGYRAPLMALLCVAALTAAFISVASCRRGTPILNPGEASQSTDGTISGTVRGPEGTSSIVGRQVEVVNVDTGERQQATTNNAAAGSPSRSSRASTASRSRWLPASPSSSSLA